MLASTAAPYANTVLTKWGHAACSLPFFCASVNGFRGAPHQIIPKAMGARTLDACQLTKCLDTRLQKLVFFTQERSIHLNIAPLTEEASVRMSCSSAWKLLLLLVYVTLHTSHCLLAYIYLMWTVGNQSEMQTCKASSQVEKHPSPTFPNGRVRR